jgi:hypothetical protein
MGRDVANFFWKAAGETVGNTTRQLEIVAD